MLRKMQIQRLPMDGAAAMPQWLQDNVRERIGRLAKGQQLSVYSTKDKCVVLLGPALAGAASSHVHPPPCGSGCRELRLGVGWMRVNGRWIRHLNHPSEETVRSLFREVTDGLVYANNEVIFDSSMALAVADLSLEEQKECIREMQNIQARGFLLGLPAHDYPSTRRSPLGNGVSTMAERTLNPKP